MIRLYQGLARTPSSRTPPPLISYTAALQAKGGDRSISYAGPQVLVLYLKRPRGKISHSDALYRGASDTAT